MPTMDRKPTFEELERKVRQLEKENTTLRQSGERLQLLSSITENMSDSVVATNANFEITYLNKKAEELLGYRLDEVQGQSPGIFNAEPNADEIQNWLYETVSSGKVYSGEHLNKRKNGTTFLCEYKVFPLVADKGETYAYIGVQRDITERKQAEEALRESEKKYRIILESMEEGYHEVDLKGRFTFFNKSFQKILGYSSEELMGMSYRYYAADETNMKRVGEAYRRVFDTGESLHDFVWEVVRKDGVRRSVEVSAYLIRDKENNAVGFRGLVKDVTERRRAELEKEKLQDQLNQAQKMESVGRLAGGVAHDFNNKLSVILGYSEMALMEMEKEDPHYQMLKNIQDTAKQSADLTRQLLAFARKQTIAPRTLSLNEMVEGMLKMLRRLLGEDIDLAWEPDTNLWWVNMDPSQIDQILVNLCVNARDAISGVGKIIIETENVVADESYCAEHVECMPGEYVMLAVSDDGTGMDKEILDNIFEPFFTTKEVDKGTGLGLSTVYGIVKQNNGFVNVYSEPGEGTTFRIYIPRHVTETGAQEAVFADDYPRGEGETILLVEDDTKILDLGKTMLKALGYRVLTANSTDEALAKVEAESETIHLLLTDVVMPRMSGGELADTIKSRRPEIKALFMSGYTADVIAHHGVLDKGVHFIEKPFSMGSLARKIREALEGDSI